MDSRFRGNDEACFDLAMTYFVYMLASKPHGTLYIGVTNDLVRRVYEHRTNAVEGFTKRFDVKTLVYFEEAATAESAIMREKQLKKWRRAWKIELIERDNPTWADIYPKIAA